MADISPSALRLLADCEPDADLAKLNSQLRNQGHSTEDVLWVLSQLELRQRAKSKLGEVASTLFFTRSGLEQASRWEVAQYHARRLQSFASVSDLGCGLGIDSLAFEKAGLEVVAIERDPEVAKLTAMNLSAKAKVVNAEAEQHAITTTAVWLDPARRDLGSSGKTRKMLSAADFSPSLDFVFEKLRAHPGGAKLAPGLPLELIPDDFEATWVSHNSDLVELSLWSVDPERTGMRSAVQVDDERITEYTGPIIPGEVSDVQEFIFEPDPALIRSGLLGSFAKEHGLTLISPDIAYLSGQKPVDSSWLRGFRVLEQLPLDRKQIAKRLRELGIGKLEIKKRGVDIDPADFRKQLGLKGEGAATLILTRVGDARRALVCAES